jgi:uncharacterized protein YkwD
MERKRSALILAVLVLAGAGVAGAARTNDSVRLTALDSSLLIQINAVRRAHALHPLTLSDALSAAADGHTAEMGRFGYFGHASLDRTPFGKRIERHCGRLTWSVGENLLWVERDLGASEAVRAWMNSPEHRAILLDPAWRQIGIASRRSNSAPGIYGGRAVTIVTSDFGVRCSPDDRPLADL